MTRATPTYLVWFAGPTRRGRASLEAIRTAVELDAVDTDGNDKVYRVKPAPRAA